MNGKSLKILSMAVLSVLVLAFSAWAGPVSPDDAQQVAENWIDYIVRNDGSWGAFKSAEATRIEPFFVRGELVGYVVDVAPLGFVLVPSDDQLPPIKAYSTDSIFNTESKGFAEWIGDELNDVVSVLRREASGSVRFMPVNAELWKWLREEYNIESLPAISAIPAPVLTTTNWDQMDPYNRFCPEYKGEICPVGCVATATIQVMRYWSWPPQGTGSHSYSWRGQTLSADFNHPYDWANMPDSLNFATNSQKDEVARLGSDVGIAYNMDYHPDGSGAYTTDAQSVMPGYFYYSDEIAVDYPSGDDYAWFKLFKDEVDAGRPALMSIRGPSGGHAVVCDGYRTDSGNLIHINMGWGGWLTAYYATNNIVSGSVDFSYDDMQQIIRSIKPNETQPAEAVSSASPMGGKAPVTVSFAGQGKRGAGPYTYSWDFGDGGTGEGQFPTHLYQHAGAYTVTLTATDTLSQTATDSHLVITVTGGTGLSAAAQASVTSGQAPLAVTFTAVAQGGTPSYSYIWNFGDGSSETTSSATVSHTYTTAGTFTAILTVKDSVGQQTTASALTITVAPAVPPPVISSVTKLTSPFRLRVMGSNFLPAAKVKINGVAVSQTLFKNSTKLVAKGADVKTMCPKGVTVKVTVDNGDGSVSSEFSYTR
ncbi:MAG TPA: C10 family peptidase [Acidobacteriota bacterium]|nr:C10 family peptidase [Acidobacteriota bacterium]HQO19171.1 C10 family peptidase [Acidobacteriota bacterium]HQQ46448.1 C10 family peptidase [Acidobacteriota bacterium]